MPAFVQIYEMCIRDRVCSPAGTTIKAVRVLEKEGLRSAVIEAMDACVDAAKGM